MVTKYERLLEDLATKGTGKMKVFGNSMLPKIQSGSTLTYQKQEKYEIDDIVFCRVGRFIDAHLITKIDSQGRYMISNNKGRDNGWTKKIFGKVVEIELPK